MFTSKNTHTAVVDVHKPDKPTSCLTQPEYAYHELTHNKLLDKLSSFSHLQLKSQSISWW